MRLMAAGPFWFWEERGVMGAAISENVEVWDYVMAVQAFEKWVVICLLSQRK